jgi:hypothetical protein
MATRGYIEVNTGTEDEVEVEEAVAGAISLVTSLCCSIF